MPFNFLLPIYNDEILLKEAEFREIREIQRKKTEELKFNYRPKNSEEKKEIDRVLMTCWNIGVKLLRHLKMVLFHLNI